MDDHLQAMQQADYNLCLSNCNRTTVERPSNRSRIVIVTTA